MKILVVNAGSSSLKCWYHDLRGDALDAPPAQPLWSKHVDVQPGDRAEACSGPMEPVAVEGSSPDYMIVHVCTRCKTRRRNKTVSEDSTVALLGIVQRVANAS